MLDPSERRLLFEALRPPPGYQLDRAVGTTFTLDLMTLMALPLAFTKFRWAEDGEGLRADPLGLLEGLRTHAQRIHVFCDLGHISVPPPNRPLLGYVEDSVIPVKAPNGGLFHPKVWVQRFAPAEDNDGPIRYRLIVSSRNLTFDRSWDTLVCLEGELQDRKNGISANRPIGELIHRLPEIAVSPVNRDVIKAIEQISYEVRRVRFEPPPGVDEITFHALGLDTSRGWALDEPTNDLLVIAPFVTDDALATLCDQTQRSKTLISRVEELGKVSSDVLTRFDKIYVLDDSVLAEDDDEGEDATDGDSASDGAAEHEADEATLVSRPPDDALSGLHAKAFVLESGWDAHTFLGSSNATTPALGSKRGLTRNVEFLVGLKGKRAKLGITPILAEDAKQGGLRSMLRSYTPLPEKEEADPTEAALDSALAKAQDSIEAASLTARVTLAPSGDYGIELSAARPEALALPPGVQVMVRPATLALSGAASLNEALESPGGSKATPMPIACFEPLGVEQLSAFFAFRAEAREGSVSRELSFALRLPLSGVPEDRAEKLLQALLKDGASLVRYLLMLLLGGADADDSAHVDLELRPKSEGNGKQLFGSATPLFEALVSALDKEPERLRQVAQVITDLRKTKEGQALLPDGLEELWAPFEQIVQELES